ncbi:MAG: hypothetical protein WAK75_07295 [Methanoregula sp.]|uniref:hypothetical protein n=1 Tax=Methanoregula sp. TaxID=2052170 RepID=UPI003BB1C55E
MDADSGNRQHNDTGENTVNEEPSHTSYENVTTDPCPPVSRDAIPGMTLEQIIDMTGEFAHLHELIMIHIEQAGGFAGADAYFRTVQPLLDLLEIEIRIRCRSGLTPQQMKLVVQDWIDQEIKACMERTVTRDP